MTANHRLLTCCSILALAVVGCVTPAQVGYLTLEAPASDVMRRDVAAVSVGPIALPDFLKRSGLARRDAAGALHYSTTTLWAEPLDRGIQRTLVDTLSYALGDTPVLVFPHTSSTAAHHSVRVDLRQLEVTDTRIAMHASWSILALPAPTGERVSTGTFRDERSVASPDGPAIARGISGLVQALGLDIAAALPAD